MRFYTDNGDFQFACIVDALLSVISALWGSYKGILNVVMNGVLDALGLHRGGESSEIRNVVRPL